MSVPKHKCMWSCSGSLNKSLVIPFLVMLFTLCFNMYYTCMELTFGILLSFAIFVLHAPNFSAFCEIIFPLFWETWKEMETTVSVEIVWGKHWVVLDTFWMLVVCAFRESVGFTEILLLLSIHFFLWTKQWLWLWKCKVTGLWLMLSCS